MDQQQPGSKQNYWAGGQDLHNRDPAFMRLRKEEDEEKRVREGD